jgi:CelD/BcsL family acetyltransferase involved in cellulose biosynthesis
VTPTSVTPARAATHLSVRVLDWPCCGAPSIVARWDELARVASEPNPFIESWYLLPALRALDPDETVRIILLECGDELVGLLPLANQKRYYRRPIPHLAGWTHPNAFLGTPLIAAGHELAFWRELLAWADRNAGNALFLHLSELGLDGPVFKALTKVIAEQDRTGAIVHREERALLASTDSPETYFAASLSGKKRKELRRQHNRLGEHGVVAFERLHDDHGLAEWTDTFLELESGGWKGEAGSALALADTTANLFRSALAGAAVQGCLERLTLTLDGKPIAMLATFLCAPGAFSFKTAFDESFSKFSPGVLLQCENLMILDRADIAWTDSCASADHPMIDHIWRERRTVAKISVAIGGGLRRKAFGMIARAELRRKPKETAKKMNAPAAIFPAGARTTFATNYPEVPHVLAHDLRNNPLFELEALAQLAEGLPDDSIEYNRGDLPIGVDGKPPRPALGIGATIRGIADTGSWAVLKNIEQNPLYANILADLLDELRPQIEARTGQMMHTQAFMFVSSPNAVTPYHFDPEHNILLQLRGSKVMTQFPAGDARFAADEVHEGYHTGGPRELIWRDELASGGNSFAIKAGEAVFVPVMAPHFVNNGPGPSISLSITWRSEWSFAESDARAFNGLLRRIGIKPRTTGRWPARNLAKAYGWRLMRKLRRS